MNRQSRLLGIVFVILSLVMTSTDIIAGDGSGHITEFTAHVQGNYAFTVETVINRLPCATGGNGRFITNQRDLMAALLAARLANRQVYVGGTGQCNVWGDAETIWYIYVW